MTDYTVTVADLQVFLASVSPDAFVQYEPETPDEFAALTFRNPVTGQVEETLVLPRMWQWAGLASSRG